MSDVCVTKRNSNRILEEGQKFCIFSVVNILLYVCCNRYLGYKSKKM